MFTSRKTVTDDTDYLFSGAVPGERCLGSGKEGLRGGVSYRPLRNHRFCRVEDKGSSRGPLVLEGPTLILRP